jgi:hypothetical protein
MFSGVLRVTDGVIEGVNVRGREWFLRAGAREAFIGMRSFPSMGSKEAFEVGGTVHFDVSAGLFEVDAIEGGGHTKIFKRGVGFTR